MGFFWNKNEQFGGICEDFSDYLLDFVIPVFLPSTSIFQ